MVAIGYSSDGSDSPQPSNGPSGSKTTSGVVAVLCGALVCFILFMIAFLCWRNVYPYLLVFKEWLSDKGQNAKRRLWRGRPRNVVLPTSDTSSATEPILEPPPPPFVARHGPGSVDTLPLYTPSDRPSTPPLDYSRATSETG